MSSQFHSGDDPMEGGSLPLDIDNVHMLLQVEQEQIQKRTFTNWVNAQLAKRRPPCRILDLFSDFRDGSRLLDLLEVMSGQRISRDRGRGMFQHRSNIEKALAFLKKKSVKLVNINIPDIMDGKPSIILGLIWTIILQYHIEELASCLSFDSRQSSMESLASLDTRSTLSSRSASASPAPARGSPLHHRFRVSARKALLLWVREQCHRAGCSVNVKDFKASWRSGVVFLAVMSALRPDLVDLSRARTRSNKQNLEEAFRIAEKELRIPRLLDPEDVDVRDPDEKSIMTYVAQFLQYSRDFPAMEEESQTQYLTPPKCPSPVSLPVHYTPAVSASPLRKATPDRKAQEVTCWLGQAYDELLEGWDSTEGESYSERYHVFQTFVVSFNEQRRPIMPLLTAMRRSGSLSEEQRALREAWDALSEKLREYRVELDMSLPPPLDTVGSWLLRTEAALVEEQGEPQDHGRAADEAREKQELLRVCLEEMPQQMKTFQSFKNMDEYGNMMVPSEKMDELKRRFTSVRVTAKYHGIKLEYREHRHTVLDLLGQIRTKLHIWKKPFISSEAVRVLMQECHEIVNVQEIPSLLESALQKLKQISEKYSNKSALAADYHQVSQQVKQLEEETAAVLREVPAIRSTMGQVLSAWDSYDDSLSSFQAWLEQNSVTRSSNSRPLAASDSVAEWTAQHSRLNELGSFLMGSTDPQSSRNLAEELRKLNLQWEEFLQTEPSEGATESVVDQTNAQNLQALIREATLILKKPLEVKAGPLRTYRKRLQFIIRKIKDVDLDLLSPSPEFPSEPLQKVKLATPEIVQTLLEAEQVCVELQLCVSGLDSRLAELLHWEGEARELHRALKASDRHIKQQGQDPRARATISRGLQLEGQVVTEEQDLQVLVMTSQKNSPIQYIHATTLHDRVQAAVAQSQEAIGMLSSLGARRDRSRSPPEVTPPSKVFIQAKGNAQQLKEQTQHPKMNTLPAQFGDTSVPSIVVQEYRGETMMSPPMPFNPEQAVTASPPQGQTQTRSETSAEAQEPEHSLQIQDQNKQNKNEDLRQETKNQKQKQVTKVDQQQVEQSSEGATLVQDQQELKTSNQKVAAKKLSSKELQSRKIQAMKNRPWLQKTALGQQKSTNPNSASSPGETQKLQEVPSRSTKQTQQRKDDQQRQINPPSKVKQQKEKLQQQEKEQQPDNQKLQSGGKHAQANSGTKTKVQNVSKAQNNSRTKTPKTSQSISASKPQSAVQPQAQPVSNSSKDNQQAGNVQLTEMKETEIPDLPQPHDSLKVQSMSQPPTQLSLHPGTQHQPQMFVPAGCELSVQPQGLVHAPAFAQHQIRPQISSSPQAPLPVHIQTPVPSHIQLRSHPQTWAPVRPPSPKPPSQNFSQPAGSHGNLQTSIQQQIQPQLRSQSQVQVCPPSVGYPQDQTHGKANTTFAHPEVKPNPIQPLVNPQIQGRGTDHRPLHPVAGPVAQWSTHASTPSPQQGLNAQGQMQVWTQVKASSSVRVQGPQAAGQHQLYPQAQIPSQQHQPISPPRHPVPQPYSQHSQTQTFAAVQASQQWPKQDPQINPYDYSHMGALYGQPPIHPQMLAQTWTQTQPQNIPQGPISQIPQMGPYNVHQKEQGLVPPQTGVQRMPQVHQQHPQNFLPVQHQLQTQLYQTQSQMQSQIQIQPMPSDPLHSPFTSAAQLQARIETRPESHQGPSPVLLQQPTSHSQLPQPFLQLSNQPKPQIKSDASPQPEGLVQFSPSTSKPQVQPLTQNQDGSLQKSQVQMPGQHMALPPNKSEIEWPQQARVEAQAEVQPSTQPTLESVGQVPKQSAMTTTEAEATPQPPVQSGTTSKPEVQALPRFTADSQTQAEIQTLKQPKSQDHQPQQNLQQTQTTAQPKVQFPPETKPDQNLSQSKSQSEHPVQPKSQQPQPSPPLKVHMQPKVQAESPDFQKAPALAQAPPQAYTEAYSRAQALARNGFEEAKRCLQAHIMDIISVFQEKSLSAGQTSITQETLKTLDPELLEEFLRAAEGMEAFCTPSQLRDMELFTQSVRTQWEACFSADIVGAGKDLDALKNLCDTLNPEDAHRLAQSQLVECEKRLAAIQHQFSGDHDQTQLDSKIPQPFSEEPSSQKEPKKPSEKHQVPAEATEVSADETEGPEKKSSAESSKKEAFERYENCKKTLQAQLGKNEQSLQELPSDSVSLKGLHTRLQEIQFMRQETESLWSEYMNQCSQLGEDVLLEQERTGLQDQWRSQQTQLQRRGSSLGTALRQIDSTENHMVDFSERLDRYLRQPKDVSGFSLAKSNILRDIKELDDNIQSELDQLSRLNPESCELDPRECFPLIREVETHKASLDQLRQQVRKSEAAARALDHFLMSLRTLDEDISGVQGAPCSDGALLQECRAKLALIRQSIDSLKEKAPQLDLLLQGARLTVTRDGGPASCLDMVSTLLRRQEEADGGLAGQQRSLQKESQSKSLGLRKRKMMGELQKLEETVEKQDLKEPTIPAVQHMLRSLLDLEGQLQTLHSELQVLREQQDRPGGGENLLQELETQWNNTQRSFFERKNVCNSLLELLKKFQMSRSQLSNTIQKAEQTISEQASYMGKDNLQRCISRVCDMKEELGGLSQQIEELRGVCRQLQSELKKFPACSEPCFEAEADSLMDSWLDLTEKIDGFMDNLQVGLELWEKQLMLGGEVDSWAGAKLALFAESHPFQQEQQVLDMRDEIRANEENIAHFHKKSLEIQEMLQSQEAPLELQVMETQLRKRMEQVKELFTDCTDVFEELTAVRKHLTEKVKECQTAVDNIQHCLRRLDSSQPAAEAQMQAQCDTLQCQEERVEALLREMGMVSSVASPLVLEELTADCSTLKENIAHTKAMIQLRREEREQGTLKVIREKQQSFEESFQDLQLSVNECFENPESRSDVETNVHRLSGFLKSKDAERRLEQLEDQLRRCSGPERSELSQWLKEQQEEVSTFTSHCLSRQRQMEALLSDLERLQQQHDDFCEWIHSEEQRSVGSEDASGLLRDLYAGSEKAEALSELMASVRRQGVRAENLLKEGDNAIQRYRNLEARLQKRVQVQDALRSQLCHFETQAESTKSWISQLLQPLTAPGSNSDPETLKSKALALLNSRAEGEAKVSDLRTQMERLSEQEEFEESRKQEVQQVVRDAEKALRSALSAAEEALRKAETQALLDKQLAALQSKNDSLRSWIEDLSENLASLRDHQDPEEKLKIAQTVLSSRSTGETRLQDLKEECQTLCDNKGLTEDATQMISSAVRKTEEQWWEVLRAAGAALKQAEEDAASVRNFEAFKAQTERVQTWIREQRQKLLDLGSHAEFEERLQTAQAFRSLTPEGDSKLQDLKTQGERLCEPPQGSRTPEVQQLVTFTEQQWTSVLQILRQVELRALSDDFNAQTKATEAWVREQEQKLEAVGCHGPPEDRERAAKAVLTSRPEGDFKVNNLRRRGQSVCDHQDADEARRVCVQQSVKETEQQWRKLLESAKQLQAAAEADISQETERKMSEWREFNTSMEETECWLEDLLQQLDSGRGRAEAQDRLRAGQAIVNSETETESRLQRLAAQAQRVCHQDLEEHKKQEVKQKVKDTEERWTRILDAAKQVVSQAERRCALEHQLKDLQAQREDFRKRLEERQHSLLLQDSLADPEEAINTAKDVLSFKPDGDSRLAALRRQCQSLLDQEGLEEQDRREALETLEASEEQWKTLLEAAERSLQRAEVRYSLCRELEAFCTHAGSTESWIGGLQTRADAMRGGTQGSKAQIEERLNIAQTILSSRSQGSAQLMELKRRAQSLYEHEDLEEDRRVEVQQKVGDMEEQWRTLVQNAEDTERELQALVERLLSCQYKRGQAETRLAELQKQLSNLQCVFPWPGLGERRQAVDQARTLLEQSAAVAPLLSDVRTQAAELMEITKDQSWADPCWTVEGGAIAALQSELTDVLSKLECGIVAERQCTLLMEQHQAAQDWLREQVKGLGPPPTDRHGLHNAVNNLKALIQTVTREQREMKELDSARDSLLNLCTPAGQDALNLEVSKLYDLQAGSEKEVRERMAACELRLEESDRELARMAGELKERAAALQWELRSLDQALSYSEPQNNIAQLQQHWHSLQNCENSLEDLGVKVQELHQEVQQTSVTKELPAEILSLVESLCQQHTSLRSRLSEHLETCSANTTSCLKNCICALQRWNQSCPADSVSALQAALQEGKTLRTSLQEALSCQEFLTACLMHDKLEELQKQCLETYGEADIHTSSLKQNLKEHEQQKKQQPEIQSSEETKISVVAPPRKKKRSVEKCQVKLQENVSVKEESTSFGDAPSLPPEAPAGMEVREDGAVLEQTGVILSSDEIQGGNLREEKTDEEMKLVPQEPVDGAESSLQNREGDPASDETMADELKVVSTPTETPGLELKEVLPPRRKSKSLNLPLQDAEQKVSDNKPESERLTSGLRKETEGSLIEEAKLIPVRRKSKSGVVHSTELTISHHASADREHDGSKSSALQAETETKDTILTEDKPSPSKRRSKEDKYSVDQVHFKTKETCQTEEIPKQQKKDIIDQKSPDSADAEALSDEMKESDKGQKTENTVLEESRVTPPKRRSKGAVSLSGETSLQLKEARTPLESAPDQSVTITSTEDNALKSVSGTQDPSAEMETQTMKKPGTQEASEELTPNTGSSSQGVIVVSEDVKKGKISPPRRKIKAQKLSIELETIKLSETSEDSHLVQSTEQKEAVPVEMNELTPETGFRNSLESMETEKETQSQVLELSAQPDTESTEAPSVMLIEHSSAVEEPDSQIVERKSSDVDFSTVLEPGLQDFTDEKVSVEEVDKPATALVTEETECVVDSKTKEEDISSVREPALDDQEGDGSAQSHFLNLESVSEAATSAPPDTKLIEGFTAQGTLKVGLVVDDVCIIQPETQEQLMSNVEKQTTNDHETSPVDGKEALEEQHLVSSGNTEFKRTRFIAEEHSQQDSSDITSSEQSTDDPRQFGDMETSQGPAAPDLISTSITSDVQEEPKKADATHIDAGQQKGHEGDLLPCTRDSSHMEERMSSNTEKESVCAPFLKDSADVETESQARAELKDTSSEVVDHAGEAAFEYFSAVGTQGELQLPKDVETQEKKVFTIILDTSQPILPASPMCPSEGDFTKTCNELDLRLDTLDSEFQEPERKSDDASKQSEAKFTDSNLVAESHKEAAPCADESDSSDISKYIDNLYESIWKNQMEIQGRYLVLSVPDTAVFQTCEEDLTQPEEGTQSDSSTTAPHAAAWTQAGVTEMTKTSPSEDDTSGQTKNMDQVKLSDQQTCLERPANVLDSLVQKKQSEEFTNDVPDVPESQEKVREVRILQLDMSTRPEEEEEDSMSFRLGKELRIDITKTIIQDEPETRPEVQDTLSQTDLAKLHPSCQTTEPKTELIEIQLFEQTGVEPRETEISKVLKEESSQDEDSSLSIHGNDTSLACLDEVISKKVPIGAEECVLYLDIKTTSEDQEHTLRETEITIDVVQADIQTERLNETSADSVVEHDMPEIKTEEQQSRCRDSGALMQFSSDNTKMSLHPADVVTQTETAELMKTTQEGPAQVMEEDDVRERSTQRLELEEKLVTIQREPDMLDSRENTSSNVEEHELVDQPIPQNEAVVDATDKILDKLESTTTHEEVQERVSDFQSKNDPVTAERNVEQPPLTMEEDEQRERNVTMETPLEVIEEPQTEEISGTDRTTPSAECEVPHLGESFHMKREEQSAPLKPHTEAQKRPMESALDGIFTEMLTGSEVFSQFMEHKSEEDALEALTTSNTDLGLCLSRLAFKVQCSKNRSAELCPTAMTQQIEELQECTELIQGQQPLFAQLKGGKAEPEEALKVLWSSALQDAAAVIQNKEVQLQLVTDYCRQIQAAKTTVDRLTAELDAMKMSPQASCQKEVEQLCCFQRSLEENRTVLGELLMIITKLCLHLNASDREAVLTEQKSLQEKWKRLERTMEHALQHTNTYFQQSSNLLSDLSGLQEYLEMTKNTLETMSSSEGQWNWKDAQQLMEANAKIRGARQQYLHFRQLFEDLLVSSRWEEESKDFHHRLQEIKDKLHLTEELVSSQTKNHSNPIMEKMLTVMSDGLAWAKKTECDIECKRRKAPLLPEEVYWQFRDLKKLQSDVIAKQDQLETLVEEVVELLPSLDQAEEVPIIQTSLESLEELSRSTSEKLSQAIKDMEFALQTREKLSEQIADLDSWVVAHLQSEVSRTTDAEFRSFSKMNLRLHQIQGTLAEAERQAAVCEALLMTSRDISSELSVTETCQLYSKINNLQEDIAGIISRAKSSKEEMEELIQTTDSRKKHLAVVEKSLRQMSVDLSRYVFPITRESLQALEPWKYLMLEHKSQIDLLVPWIPQEKTSKLNSVIAELQSKIISLEIKARKHESYLNTRRCVEEIREKIHDKVKDNSRDLQETCEILLIQLPLMNRWCREAGCRLQSISPDLNPSQLIVEQQRLKQSEERLKTWESALENRIGLIACEALPEMDYQLEKRATQNFLAVIVPELQEVPSLEPNQKRIDQEYLRVMHLKKVVESKMRILEVVQQQEDKHDKESQELMDVKNGVLRECDRRMECIWQARQHLSSFTDAVRDAAQFLQDTEVSLLPPQGPAGPCRESLKETQQALASLENRFQTYVEQLQNWEASSSYLCPAEMKQLQESVLSQLLVRRATLQAQGHVQEQSLSRCVEQHANYTKSQEEILQRVRAAEERLLDLVSQKTTCLDDSNKHEEQLTALSGDTEALLRYLGELREWCPHQSCCRTREAGAAAVWRRVLDLRLCTKEVEARSKRRVSEWISVSDSLEKASGILQQLEAELPEGDAFKLSSEDLHDLLQSLEQFQDRADCEHRALSGLELRTARLLGVPAHLGQAPPIPVCQQLQVMQGRYSSVKQKSKDALLSAKRELEDREKVREDLHVVSAWMEAAGRLLLAEDEDSSTQLVYGQLDAHKASLQRITESLQMKYKEKDASVPPEIESQLQEVTNALGQIESEVAEALRKSGPNYRLGVKLSDIHTGLTSVQRRLEERSSSVMDAKVTQKCVWDELDVWHSRLAALEVEVHDLEEPQEALALTEGLVEVQQLYSLLAKQAEQRTTLLSKVPAWLQQHKEMIGSCESWMVEARTWLAAPCTYTTAKCLRSHVNALQIVLKDAAQIQATLQSFTSVLTEMSQVYDTKLLQEQLDEASLQVSAVQDSFNSPLHQLEHAAAEAEAIEKEVRQMENEVADIKTLLTSPETFPSPRESRLKMIEQRIQSMRRTVAEIQKCKPGLCLPQQAEHTLSVFTVVDQLQTLLLELEKKVPALFIQQPQTPVQSKVSSRLQGSTDDTEEEQGQIRIVHFEEDPLRRSGGVLQTVEQSPPPPSRSLKPDSSEAATRADQTAAEGGRRDDEEGSVGWRLFGSFLGTPSKASAAVSEESGAEQNRELAAAGTQGVQGSTDSVEASSPEALSKARTQSVSESAVNTAASTENVSKADSRSQQRCAVS